MLAACVFWAWGLQSEIPPELGQYVLKPDDTYSWARRTIDGRDALQLVSQTWQDAPWTHDVVLIQPARPAKLGAAIIEVTGWEPNERDYQYAKTLADSSGLPVALLFQIPNQPIWEREEDDLIGHTFEKYFETGDPSWPLLFPMVKSVVRTMDMLEESTIWSDNPLEKFVITGASKRGWTAWLVAAVRDDRVIGVAPAVFDNLDFVAQLERQQSYWAAYSPMISDYTDRGLQDLLETERGKRLIQMVDPVSYLPAVSAPVLVLTGTNDPFWTVDSAQVYWDRLVMPKSAIAIPNAGHGMGDKSWWTPSLGAFARFCAEGRKLPYVDSSLTLEPESWQIRVDIEPGPAKYRVWSAASDDLHFEEAEWAPILIKETWSADDGQTLWFNGSRAREKNLALLVELEFDQDGREFRLTTPVYLVRKR